MQIYRTNEYCSLNIFNYVITIIMLVLSVCFFAETLFIFSSLPIRIIFICLKILPFLLILCGLLIAKFIFFDTKKCTDNKNTLLQKTITTINLLFYIFLIVIAYLFFLLESDKHTIKNPKKYAKAQSIIKQQRKISHFPKTIPADAKNVQMYCYTSDYSGEVFILKFYINKKYIEQELQNNKFLNSNTPVGTHQDIYYIFTDNNRIKIDNTTWYVLDNEENKQIYPNYFPYYNSIGVSNNLDFIIYYYIAPGD